MFVVNNGAITWRSKKQTTIALSSTEAEYIALSEAGHEVCWLCNLYEELGYTQKSPNLLKGDNDLTATTTEPAPAPAQHQHQQPARKGPNDARRVVWALSKCFF